MGLPRRLARQSYLHPRRDESSPPQRPPGRPHEGAARGEDICKVVSAHQGRRPLVSLPAPGTEGLDRSAVLVLLGTGKGTRLPRHRATRGYVRAPPLDMREKERNVSLPPCEATVSDIHSFTTSALQRPFHCISHFAVSRTSWYWVPRAQSYFVILRTS